MRWLAAHALAPALRAPRAMASAYTRTPTLQALALYYSLSDAILLVSAMLDAVRWLHHKRSYTHRQLQPCPHILRVGQRRGRPLIV